MRPARLEGVGALSPVAGVYAQWAYTTDMSNGLSQAEFLRQAMEQLGGLLGLGRPMTRNELCERLGCPRPTLDKWMAPPPNDREMPSTLWSHVREVIAHEKLKKAKGR